MNIKACVSIFP